MHVRSDASKHIASILYQFGWLIICMGILSEWMYLIDEKEMKMSCQI